MTATEIAIALDKHNEHRAGIANGDAIVAGVTNSQPTASNMVKLVWDADLATVSQQHSDLCLLQHSASSTRANNYAALTGNPSSWVGENIAWVGGTGSNEFFRGFLANMHDNWSAEHVDYIFSNDTCPGGVCGHYTQVVWANTTRVGCGLTNCPGLNGAVNSALLVCAYFPGGNFNQQQPYTVGAAATNCPQEFPENDNGLCKPATAVAAGATQLPMAQEALIVLFGVVILMLGIRSSFRRS